ncbi:MAG: YggT family protein [Magnetococcus sp. WYHC-3]
MFSSIGQILLFVLDIYFWMVFARVLLSWVNPDPFNPVVQFLVRATEPLLGLARRVIPPIGGLDLSPILALLGVDVAKRLVAAVFLQGPGGGSIAQLLLEVASLVHLLFTLYMLLLLWRAGINFYNWWSFRQRRPSRLNLRNSLVRFVFQVTEPAVRPLQGRIPTVSGLDITPLVSAVLVLVLLSLLQTLTAQPTLSGPEVIPYDARPMHNGMPL